MMIGRYENGSCKIPDAIAMAAKALAEPAAPSEEDIASFIKGVRESLQLSKSAFSRLIGVSATAAGNYESGKNRPKDEILEKIKGLMDGRAWKK